MILSSRKVVRDLWMANAGKAVVFIIVLQGGTSTSLVKCHKMHTSVAVYVFFNSNVLSVILTGQKSAKGKRN